jgi:hypothetical protein
MPRAIRRYVTGLDEQGRSMVADCREIAESGGAGNFNLWLTGAGIDPLNEGEGFPFFPRKGQTLFRVFRIPPSGSLDRAALEQIAEGFFAEIGDPACKVDTTRHPLMHATPTIDYILLLSGEAELLVDQGDPAPLKPWDAVVQRGVNHMWINTGTQDAVFLAVMIGA